MAPRRAAALCSTALLAASLASAQAACVTKTGVDYYGYDLLEQPAAAATLDECAEVCSAHDLCSHFTFYPWGCYIKHSSAGETNNTLAVAGACAPGAAADTAAPAAGAGADAAAAAALGCSLNAGVDYYGYDLKMNISAGSAMGCAELCAEHDLCSHFTYVLDGCYLKTSGDGEIAHKAAVSGACANAVTTAAAATAAAATAAAAAALADSKLPRCVIKVGVDYYGYDIFSLAAVERVSAGACAKACIGHSLCTHFTYIHGGCYLKSSGAGEMASTPGAVSGRCVSLADEAAVAAAAPLPAACALEAGVNFVGSDIEGALNLPVASAKECARKCDGHAACTFFTFVWGNCHLKTAGTGRVEQFAAMSGSCAKEERAGSELLVGAGGKECVADAAGAGVDYKGADVPMGTAYYTRKTDTADACAGLCATVAECLHFTFLDARCYLKSSAGGAYPNSAAVSGSCATAAARVAGPPVAGPPVPPPAGSPESNCKAVERAVPPPDGGDARYQCDELASMRGCEGDSAAAVYIRSMCPHTCGLCNKAKGCEAGQ